MAVENIWDETLANLDLYIIFLLAKLMLVTVIQIFASILLVAISNRKSVHECTAQTLFMNFPTCNSVYKSYVDEI